MDPNPFHNQPGLSALFNPERPNTLEVVIPPRFRNGMKNLKRDEYFSAVMSTLGIGSKGYIKCIQLGATPYACRVTFKQNSERAKEAKEGIHLRNSFFFFNETKPSLTQVNVSLIPSEVSDDAVKQYFSEFGEVRKVIRVKDRDGVETGDRRILMDLQYEIPSRLPLNHEMSMQIRYQRQPTCCFNCNWWGHTFSYCPFKGRCSRCNSAAHQTFVCEEPLAVPYRLKFGDKPDNDIRHPFALIYDDDDMDDGFSAHTEDVFNSPQEMLDSYEDHELPATQNSGRPVDRLPNSPRTILQGIQANPLAPPPANDVCESGDIHPSSDPPSPTSTPVLFPDENVIAADLISLLSQNGPFPDTSTSAADTGISTPVSVIPPTAEQVASGRGPTDTETEVPSPGRLVLPTSGINNPASTGSSSSPPVLVVPSSSPRPIAFSPCVQSFDLGSSFDISSTPSFAMVLKSKAQISESPGPEGCPQCVLIPPRPKRSPKQGKK